MRYRCENCDTQKWRGFFPQPVFHFRYSLFHGVALGISSVSTKLAFRRIAYEADGAMGAIASLAACLAVLLLIYGLAVTVEACGVAAQGCNNCKSHKIYLSGLAVTGRGASKARASGN
jgi:hypothetical protein